MREAQIARLEKVRSARDEAACQATLAALSKAAESGAGNLLAGAIEAVRARATVGEVSAALERVFGRYRPASSAVSGVYGAAYADDEDFGRIQRDTAAFAAKEGRRPRMLVVKLGQDGHDRGAKVIATAFADIGFDVDLGPLFQTPAEAARLAVENDVHVIGVSTQAGAHRTLVPDLIAALGAEGGDDVMVVCGGVIPPHDHAALRAAGVAAVFGPGTNIPAAAAEIIGLIAKRRDGIAFGNQPSAKC